MSNVMQYLLGCVHELINYLEGVGGGGGGEAGRREREEEPGEGEGGEGGGDRREVGGGGGGVLEKSTINYVFWRGEEEMKQTSMKLRNFFFTK